jgi:beta-RFAP synthase
LIVIKSPARLHFGQLDLNGDIGRIYGGSGVGIKEPYCKMKFKKSDKIIVKGEKSKEVKNTLEKLINNLREKALLNENLGVIVEVENILPFHTGLGSGTQIGLTLAEGINNLYNLNLDKFKIAELVDRKHSRSAIGFGVFYYGGFITDGGRTTEEKENDNYLPPILFKESIPEDWYFIIIIPSLAKEKMAGKKEIETFKKIEKMDIKISAENSHHLLLGMLPALKEKDIIKFSKHLNIIEDNVADYFSEIQSGKYTSSYAQEIIDFLESNQVLGRGQSSWGPSLYALFQNKEKAKRIKDDILIKFKTKIDRIYITSAANTGAEIIKNV